MAPAPTRTAGATWPSTALAACSTALAPTTAPAPSETGARSPRTTAPYITAERGPIETSPMTVADGATKASLGTVGDRPPIADTGRCRAKLSLKMGFSSRRSPVASRAAPVSRNARPSSAATRRTDMVPQRKKELCVSSSKYIIYIFPPNFFLEQHPAAVANCARFRQRVRTSTPRHSAPRCARSLALLFPLLLSFFFSFRVARVSQRVLLHLLLSSSATDCLHCET